VEFRRRRHTAARPTGPQQFLDAARPCEAQAPTRVAVDHEVLATVQDREEGFPVRGLLIISLNNNNGVSLLPRSSSVSLLTPAYPPSSISCHRRQDHHASTSIELCFRLLQYTISFGHCKWSMYVCLPVVLSGAVPSTLSDVALHGRVTIRVVTYLRRLNCNER